MMSEEKTVENVLQLQKNQSGKLNGKPWCDQRKTGTSPRPHQPILYELTHFHRCTKKYHRSSIIFVQLTEQCAVKYCLRNSESRNNCQFQSLSSLHSISKIQILGSDYHVYILQPLSSVLALLNHSLYSLPVSFQHLCHSQLNQAPNFSLQLIFTFLLLFAFPFIVHCLHHVLIHSKSKPTGHHRPQVLFQLRAERPLLPPWPMSSPRFTPPHHCKCNRHYRRLHKIRCCFQT